MEKFEHLEELDKEDQFEYLIKKLGYLPASKKIGITGIDGLSRAGGYLVFHPDSEFVFSEELKIKNIAPEIFNNGDSFVWLKNKGKGQKNPDLLFNGLLTDLKGFGKEDNPSTNIKRSLDNGIKTAKQQGASAVLFILDQFDFTSYNLEKEKEKVKRIVVHKRITNPTFSIFCYFFKEVL